jgi:hypothetical protein
VRSALADIDEAIDALEARAAGDTARLVAELQDTNAPSLMIPNDEDMPARWHRAIAARVPREIPRRNITA